MAWEAAFMKAALRGNLIDLVVQDGRNLRAEPYMIYRSPRGKLSIYVYEVSEDPIRGFSPGWRTLEAKAVRSAVRREEIFEPRRDYSPHAKDLFPDVVFAIPPNVPSD